ncbi:MAG: hypothetical protein KAR21_25130, partial [Spirochaetales bacterium]|nr:hypothetical protein [Spirochaetales bacterium]
MEKKSTDNEEVKYFRIARELNHKYHKELLKKKLHIRGNKNSLSIISVNKDTAEKGISNIKNEEQIIEYIKSDLTIEEPQRKTPEKELQAWM